eukprot:764395-Pelagomonas_calceolata.AAC.3
MMMILPRGAFSFLRGLLLSPYLKLACLKCFSRGAFLGVATTEAALLTFSCFSIRGHVQAALELFQFLKGVFPADFQKCERLLCVPPVWCQLHSVLEEYHRHCQSVMQRAMSQASNISIVNA